MGDKGEGRGQKSQKMGNMIYGWPYSQFLAIHRQQSNRFIMVAHRKRSIRLGSFAYFFLHRTIINTGVHTQV